MIEISEEQRALAFERLNEIADERMIDVVKTATLSGISSLIAVASCGAILNSSNPDIQFLLAIISAGFAFAAGSTFMQAKKLSKKGGIEMLVSSYAKVAAAQQAEAAQQSSQPTLDGGLDR